MSISPGLRAAARSAYRGLFRAASKTFSGDPDIQNAFKDKVRRQYAQGRSITDEKQYKGKIQLAREAAILLQHNVVQAQQGSKQNTWKVKITEDTELGDNETISPNKKSLRKGDKPDDKQVIVEDNFCDVFVPKHPRKANYSQLKKLRDQRNVPELDEKDLEEKFVRGSGPGGQSINKTENCVQLLHKPTRIRITCQETRSLEQNRRYARKLLIEKLDKLYNPGISKEDVRKARQKERERQKKKKRRKKEKHLNEQEEIQTEELKEKKSTDFPCKDF